ncbi:ubiquitin-specific protease ubp1 [Thecaphora frezii]
MSPSTTAFVLVDPPFRQSYRLLFLLPYPAPLLHQLVALVALLALAALVAFLVHTDQLPRLHRPSLILPSLADAMSLAAAGLGLGALSLAPASSTSPSQRPASKPSSHRPLRRAVVAAPSTALGGLKRGAPPSRSNRHYPGLRNTGNTCFFNSTVQSLASIPALRQHLYDVVRAAERWDVPTPVTDALLDLIDSLNAAAGRASDINPTTLVGALRSLPSSPLRSLVSAHQQQDAHELFVLLSGAIDDEMVAVAAEAEQQRHDEQRGLRGLMAQSLPWTGKAVYSDPRLLHGATAAQQQQQHLPSAFNPAPSLLLRQCAAEANPIPPQVSPFNALLAQRTTCLDCGYMEAIRHFSTEEISLSLPAVRSSRLMGTNACSLEECFAMWCELEAVEWICWRCTLVRTREKAKMEVLRLEASVLASASVSNGHAAAVDEAAAIEVGGKPSSAKKRRLREARSRQMRLETLVSSGLSEDEVLALNATPTSALYQVLSGIKLDKRPSQVKLQHNGSVGRSEQE